MTPLLQHSALYVILALVALLIFSWLRRENADSKSPINFTDLIITNGKLNERKVVRMGTWIVSTWGFIFLIINGGLTEWYYIGYMGTWVANALIGSAINKKGVNQESQQ